MPSSQVCWSSSDFTIVISTMNYSKFVIFTSLPIIIFRLYPNTPDTKGETKGSFWRYNDYVKPPRARLSSTWIGAIPAWLFLVKFLLSRGETSDQNLMEDSRTLLMVSKKKTSRFFFGCCAWALLINQMKFGFLKLRDPQVTIDFGTKTDLMTWMIRGTPILGNLQIPDSFILIRNQWYFGRCLVF